MSGRKKILFISDEQIGATVAGPGMRYLELANAMGNKYDVWLTANADAGITNKKFNVLNMPVFLKINLGIKITLPNPALKKKLNDYDFVIAKKEIIPAFGFPKIRGGFIADLYCPSLFENLESIRFRKETALAREIKLLKKIMRHADFIICANQRQKDFYLSLLSEAERKNKAIGLVPTGIPSIPPQHTKNVLKGVVPGISPADRVILWWGGIWDWLDAETPIKAVAQASKARNDLRLVFFGIKHPNLPLTRAAQKALQLSKDLGVYEKQVFFIQQWVPYEERASWLLESDLGIICHHETLETHFSWRTRVLDYFWAGLPVITTEGDSMAELVKLHGLGKTVPPNDPDKLAQAILDLLNDRDQYRQAKENIEIFKPTLYWEKVVSAIERYIERPK